ncbi:MAG: hypothetical protein HYT22_01075 [Candidatus Niyogibacteria bacterium]|nr:hypothetical protein [Candidatus Niyogibacteria bacterium]
MSRRANVVYERNRYRVIHKISVRNPTETFVSVDECDNDGYVYDIRGWWATTRPIRWWQFWRIGLEDAIEKAQKLVDALADERWFSVQQIEQKMEELKLRQEAIRELEQESNVPRIA